MTGGSTCEPWPDQPDDEYPDFLWPDDNDEDPRWPDEARQLSGDARGLAPGQPVPFSWPVPPMPFPVHTLGAVRVGNIVEAQITVINGKAKLVTLQDPASES